MACSLCAAKGSHAEREGADRECESKPRDDEGRAGLVAILVQRMAALA